MKRTAFSRRPPVDRRPNTYNPYVFNGNMTVRHLEPVRRPAPEAIQRPTRQTKPTGGRRRGSPLKTLIVVGVLVLLYVSIAHAYNYLPKSLQNLSEKISTPATTATTNYCAGNTLPKFILVSIGKQHLWACSGSTTKYNSPVVTGMEDYAADKTPPGTYHIYAKQTNLHLTGCDTTGCWDDPVSYWMPWLKNQYGQYGFHDAKWRKPSEFGNVNIYAPHTASPVGSHGCVELPLSTAMWLYNWSTVGTTVTIES